MTNYIFNVPLGKILHFLEMINKPKQYLSHSIFASFFRQLNFAADLFFYNFIETLNKNRERAKIMHIVQCAYHAFCPFLASHKVDYCVKKLSPATT